MTILFFFFQAEDGIRDKLVTGVQTCALPIWETALRLVRSLLAWQRERFLAELDPGGPSAPGAEVDVCEMAALRGGEDWLHCSETLLALRSPLRLPFDDSLKAWRPRPTLCWSSEGETLVGMGEEFELFSDPPDLAAAAPLTWQGLRFRDGSVAARLELPLLAVGGAAGLVLRWSGRVGVLGKIGRASCR